MEITRQQQTGIIIIVTIAIIVYVLWKAGIFLDLIRGGVKGDQTPYKNIARDAYNSLSRTNVDIGDVYQRVANKLLSLTNAELTSVANEYRKMYHDKGEDSNTLRNLLNNEWLFSPTNRDLRAQINSRLDQIGAA